MYFQGEMSSPDNTILAISKGSMKHNESTDSF